MTFCTTGPGFEYRWDQLLLNIHLLKTVEKTEVYLEKWTNSFRDWVVMLRWLINVIEGPLRSLVKYGSLGEPTT